MHGRPVSVTCPVNMEPSLQVHDVSRSTFILCWIQLHLISIGHIYSNVTGHVFMMQDARHSARILGLESTLECHISCMKSDSPGWSTALDDGAEADVGGDDWGNDTACTIFDTFLSVKSAKLSVATVSGKLSVSSSAFRLRERCSEVFCCSGKALALKLPCCGTWLMAGSGTSCAYLWARSRLSTHHCHNITHVHLRYHAHKLRFEHLSQTVDTTVWKKSTCADITYKFIVVSWFTFFFNYLWEVIHGQHRMRQIITSRNADPLV